MTFDLTRCPRCEAAVIGHAGALSRTARDDGAAVMVCDRCGQREGLYGRVPTDQIQMKHWPISVDRLLYEERLLIETFRESQITTIAADDIDGVA